MCDVISRLCVVMKNLVLSECSKISRICEDYNHRSLHWQIRTPLLNCRGFGTEGGCGLCNSLDDLGISTHLCKRICKPCLDWLDSPYGSHPFCNRSRRPMLFRVGLRQPRRQPKAILSSASDQSNIPFYKNRDEKKKISNTNRPYSPFLSTT
jgi:hypothetical protein